MRALRFELGKEKADAIVSQALRDWSRELFAAISCVFLPRFPGRARTYHCPPALETQCLRRVSQGSPYRQHVLAQFRKPAGFGDQDTVQADHVGLQQEVEQQAAAFLQRLQRVDVRTIVQAQDHRRARLGPEAAGMGAAQT